MLPVSLLALRVRERFKLKPMCRRKDLGVPGVTEINESSSISFRLGLRRLQDSAIHGSHRPSVIFVTSTGSHSGNDLDLYFTIPQSYGLVVFHRGQDCRQCLSDKKCALVHGQAGWTHSETQTCSHNGGFWHPESSRCLFSKRSCAKRQKTWCGVF